MMQKLSERDIRALKIGAVGAVAIIVLVIGSKWIDHWAAARSSLEQVKAKLELIDIDKAKQAGLLSIVPVIEMPQKAEEQTFLFRNKLNEQLKKAGINNEPLQVIAGSKTARAGYKLVRLKCSAKCRLTQLLDLLAGLNENPYLVGIEELRMRCDPQKPQEVEMDLTVSTFVK
jgi:hypothetical protein